MIRTTFLNCRMSTFSNEVADMLNPQPDRLYLDATFGTGGHTEAVLTRCPQAKLIVADRDPTAVSSATAAAEDHTESTVTPLRARFSELATVLAPLGLHCLDGLTADLGVSSLQVLQKHPMIFSLKLLKLVKQVQLSLRSIKFDKIKLIF